MNLWVAVLAEGRVVGHRFSFGRPYRPPLGEAGAPGASTGPGEALTHEGPSPVEGPGPVVVVVLLLVVVR